MPSEPPDARGPAPGERPLRVVHVAQASATYGGAERATLLEVSALRRRGIDARLVALVETRPEVAGDRLLRQARALGLVTEAIPVAGRLSPRALLALGRLLGRLRPDVVHPHVQKAEFYSLLAALPRRIPLVGEIHGWTLGDAAGWARLRDLPLVDPRGQDAMLLLHERLHAPMLRLMRRVLVLTGEHRAAAIRAGIPPRRVVLLPRGHDFAALDADRDGTDWRARLGAPEGALLVGFVGRLSPEKDVATLLAAVAGVAAALPREVVVVVAGEGEQRAALEARARALGLAGRVRFTGFVERPAALLRALDLFVLPSLREGLPRTLLEAMALGRACIATRVGGSRTLLEAGGPAGERGILVPPRDPAALGAAIAALAGDPDRRRRLGDAARRHVRARYPIDRWAAAAEGIYREVAAEAGPPRPLGRRG